MDQFKTVHHSDLSKHKRNESANSSDLPFRLCPRKVFRKEFNQYSSIKQNKTPTIKRRVPQINQRYLEGRVVERSRSKKKVRNSPSPQRPKRDDDNIFSTPPIDQNEFQDGQFYIESKRVAQMNDTVINCFQLEEEKLLFVMKSKVVISNQYLSLLNELKTDVFFTNIRCFTTSFSCGGTEFL